MGDREQVRRLELLAIAQAGRDAEVELKALENADIDKADEPQPDPYMVETLRAIEQHHLNAADARAVIRAHMAAQFPALVAQQRDRAARAKRSAVDASIADDDGGPR